MREKAIAKYHALLAEDKSLTPELFARLKGLMRARRLVYGEREIGVALRPHLLTREQYDLLAQSSELIAAAFQRMTGALLENPRLLEYIGLTEMERRMARVPTGHSYPSVNGRLDAFMHGHEIKFVEYNAENPSSLTDQEGLNEVLFDVPALELFAERYRLRQHQPAEALLRAVLETYSEWSSTTATRPNVAILDWADLPTEGEFILLRNFFVARGVPTIICAPDELEYQGEHLRRGDFRIDLIYKRLIIHEFLERYDETHPLARAYINGDVCLVNPFSCKIMHKKAAFELLTDDAYRDWFTEAERETIRLSIPWTRIFKERKTLRGEKTIDLVEHIRQHRADFILKPNDDYGGRGIFLGTRASEAQWDAAISEALASDYVVQEIIELHPEVFPIFNDREWALQPMYVDTNPFIFRGQMEGAMVRLSESPIVNVTSGGGETGFFVIEGEVKRD
jgi:hypothetical protein